MAFIFYIICKYDIDKQFNFQKFTLKAFWHCFKKSICYLKAIYISNTAHKDIQIKIFFIHKDF